MTTTLDGTELDTAGIHELLAEFNADAKTYSRRGYVGTRDPRYGDCHSAIDQCLEALGW